MRICPICNEAKDLKKIYTSEFKFPDQHNAPGKIPVIECGHCGFVYCDCPDQDALDEYYSKYFYSSTGEKGWYRFHDMAANIANSRVVNKDSLILDIGSDNGYLEKLLSDRGFKNVKTLDPQLDADYTGTIFHNDVPEHSFDFIVLSHVLEHIAELRGAVKEFKRILKPGGCIYVEVPAPADYYASGMIELSLDFSLKHINAFDQKHLDALFSGWNKVSCGRKTFDISQACVCPCVWAIYTTATEYADGICDLIEWTKTTKGKAQEWIESIDSPVILWAFADLASVIVAGADIEIAEIVDSVLAGYTVEGMTIKAEPTTDYPIVIISSRHVAEIKAHIERLGLKNKVYVYGEGSIE